MNYNTEKQLQSRDKYHAFFPQEELNDQMWGFKVLLSTCIYFIYKYYSQMLNWMYYSKMSPIFIYYSLVSALLILFVLHFI